MKEISTELYQDLALQFFQPGHRHHEALDSGLLEEAEEVFYAQTTDSKLDELSDVLWYITVMAVQENSSLKSLMLRNINKLERRRLVGKRNDRVTS